MANSAIRPKKSKLHDITLVLNIKTIFQIKIAKCVVAKYIRSRYFLLYKIFVWIFISELARVTMLT